MMTRTDQTLAPRTMEPRTIKAASGTGRALVALCILCWIPALWLHASLLRIHVPDAFEAVLLSPSILLFWGALLILALCTRLHARFASHITRTRAALRRAAWIPSAISIACLALPWSPWLTGIVFQLALPGLLAWNLWGWFANDNEAWQPPAWMSRCSRWIPLGVLASVTLLHTLTGLYFTEALGEHSGDEGHYLIQAQSLWDDGDLDIRNNFGGDTTRIKRSYAHISPNSIGGKWYSWHSPGLSFLLAPTVDAGLWARHLLLGFCSGLALCGLYRLAILLGARIRHALLLVCLTAASTFWGVYASRALPEVLGAALAVWGLYGVLMQNRHPWASLLPACIAIGFLPWVQTRFLPIALVLWGAYGLHGLLQPDEPWIRRIPRLAFFSALSIGLLLAYRFVQLSMFTNGSSYGADGLLFSHPAGLWHALASSRGILYMFPLFAFAFAALFLALFRKKGCRLPAFYAILLFASVWLSSCATVWFTGGACLPGRFLLATLLPMLAVTAVILRKAPPAFLRGVLIAGMYSVCIFVAMLSVLPAFGKSFGTPHNLEIIHPFYSVMTRFLYDPYAIMAVFPAIAIYLGALLLLALPGKHTVLTAIGSTLMLLALALTAEYTDRQAPSPRKHAALLDGFRLHGKHVVLVPRSNPQRIPRPVEEVIDRFHDIIPTEIKHVTTRDLGVRVDEKWISLPYIEINDWDQRPYHWATIVPPFPAGKGFSYVAIRGELQGSAIAHLAIREGATTHVEKELPPGEPLHAIFAFETRGRGDVYVLLRFEEGDGQFLNHATHAGRFPQSLVEKGLIHLESPPPPPPPFHE